MEALEQALKGALGLVDILKPLIRENKENQTKLLRKEKELNAKEDALLAREELVGEYEDIEAAWASIKKAKQENYEEDTRQKGLAESLANREEKIRQAERNIQAQTAGLNELQGQLIQLRKDRETLEKEKLVYKEKIKREFLEGLNK